MSNVNLLGFNCDPKETKVVVAMSGGVDSSVTAAILVKAGYDVVGITLQLYDYGKAVQRQGACCAGSDINDARQVASSLGIPHYVLDYETKFKEQVIDEFADEYLAGRTPIPCVRCNQTVKFTDLFNMAKDLKADALATGHYVQRVMGENEVELHRGVDIEKDQSYFLCQINQFQLQKVRTTACPKLKWPFLFLASRGLRMRKQRGFTSSLRSVRDYGKLWTPTL